MSDLPKLGIVLNPAAGRGRAIKIEKPLIEYLKQRNIFFKIEKTEGPQHATSLASEMSKEFDIIVAVGGDGTVNEVAAGLIGSTASLALVPIGSGNDFNRLLGIPRKLDLAIETIISGRKKSIDLGRVAIQNSNNKNQIRYFINTLGIGIDAEIAKEAKSIKYLRGLPLYVIAALKALIKYTPNEYNIYDGDIVTKEVTYLICAGNGIYEGGGFRMLPNANPSDSKLSICLIQKMSILNALPVALKIIRGTHESHDKISMWETKSLKISSLQPFILHGDGEIFQENAIEVIIDLIPDAINVIMPTEQVYAL